MWNVYPKTFGEIIEQRIRNTEAGIRKAQEELYVNKDPIKVGDKVEAPRHGHGTVLAIVGDNAWVQTPVRDYPLTFDVKKLKKVPPPRVGILGLVAFKLVAFNEPLYGQYRSKAVTFQWNVEAVELTAEVRERIKDLI